MNIHSPGSRVDPIMAEVLRTRMEAIGQEAGAAVEQTAISPIVTESRDYSVTICDARGYLISAMSVAAMHFGAAAHAVRSTLARYGEDIAPGDLFIANDPHSGGGLHPQDIVVQQPVFVGERLVAWVALAAHMMDMGGMVPGSSAVLATECYQEALRLPPVRLIRRGVEVSDVWDIIRTNIRSAALIEMDMRSLVIGAHVAEAKLAALIGDTGPDAFEAAMTLLIETSERVLRARIADIEDGTYSAVGWVEWNQDLFRVPCDLVVDGDRLIFDLRQAPPQVPHFFNSKEYIIRASMAPLIRTILAPGLPLNQAVYTVTEILSTPGTLVDSRPPAPIAAAHMDAAIPVSGAALQCLQLAIHASPKAWGREYNMGPPVSAYATGRWSYAGPDGNRQAFTILDGSFCGSPAAWGRDGLDLHRSLVPSGTSLEYADIEILETAYPLLFHRRGARRGGHGYGEFRSGAGCEESFSPHGIGEVVGNMTGARAWLPPEGGAGGLPGATNRFQVTHADGVVEPVDMRAVGLSLKPGDRFDILCASGGGYGDPLDRRAEMLRGDLDDRRLDRPTAERVYGAVFSPDGGIDAEATERRREAIRRERLAQAAPPATPPPNEAPDPAAPAMPIYPGVAQRGRHAIAERSGAVLAVAPDNWLAGCPVIETLVHEAQDVVMRVYLDPLSGRSLHVDVARRGDTPSIGILPRRWTQAATTAAEPQPA